MHSAFFPNKNGVHRLACLSLYRALLRQCAEFSPKAASHSNAQTSSSSSILRALVRHRFKSDRKFKQFSQITNALQFGRNILQLLENAAAGSAKALEEMARILSSIPQVASKNKEMLRQIQSERGQRPLPHKIVKGKIREAYLADKTNYQRNPNVTPVLKRPEPYEQSMKRKDGRRRVPNYFVNNGIPILRYSRGTPLTLSRYIAARAKGDRKLWDRSAEQEETIALAELEDEWDKEISSNHHVRQTDSLKAPGDPWTYSSQAALNSTQSKLAGLHHRDMRWGAKLWDVYTKEAALGELENSVRKEVRRQQWEKGQAQEEEKDKKETERVSALFVGLQEDLDVEQNDELLSYSPPSSTQNYIRKRRSKAK